MKKNIISFFAGIIIIFIVTFIIANIKLQYVFEDELILSEDVESILPKYPDLKSVIKPMSIPLKSPDNLIPQGLTIMNSYFLYTAYNEDESEPSECFVIDKFGNLKNRVTLDISSHVGAIAYDDANKLLWIPGKNGSLNTYRAEDFLKEEVVENCSKFDHIGEGLPNYKNESADEISYLTIYEDILFVGSFSKEKKGLVKRYKIVKDGTAISLEYVDTFAVPPKIQGITFHKEGKDTYMLLSSSYGRKNSSFISIYEYTPDEKDYSKVKKYKSFLLPPLLEQITVHSENLYIIFEANARKFENCQDRIRSICILDIEKMLEA